MNKMVLPLSCGCLNRIQRTSLLKLSKRTASTQASQAVLIEKTLEEPIIVLREEDNVDIIGPPDPTSNIRPVIRKILKNETCLQKRFRELADSTQHWNQKFWAVHNMNFIKEKERYIKQHTTKEKQQLNADEMSEFYKDFLNKYWKDHVKYNFEWYGKNFTLLFLSLRVSIQKLHHKVL